jgi:hypothetical protein
MGKCRFGIFLIVLWKKVPKWHFHMFLLDNLNKKNVSPFFFIILM